MSMWIVICNYRSTRLTIDCLRTIEPEIRDLPEVRVVICENGSGDDSEAVLTRTIRENGWGGWASVKAIHPNRGFAGGNNAVLVDALADPNPPRYLHLLNADTLLHPGAIRALIETMDANPRIGVLGSRLEYPDGAPQTACFRFHSPLSELIRGAQTGPITRLLQRAAVPVPNPRPNEDLDWTSFASSVIRREALEQAGLLDEGYFLYFEDTDLCRRIRNAGWLIRHCPESRVVHLIGQTNPVASLSKMRKRRPRYYYAARARYFAKFYGRTGLWWTNLMWIAGRSISKPREVFFRRPSHVCTLEWRDNWTNWRAPMTPWSRADEADANRRTDGPSQPATTPSPTEERRPEPETASSSAT